MRELATLTFVQEASNIILLGPPGVGKTHLAVSLGIEAIRQGVGVYFVTAHTLVEDLKRAYADNRLDRRIRVYIAPRVLIIDEVGYRPFDSVGAAMLFQLVSARYERGAIILTSNKGFGEWGEIFGDTVVATAILDRLLHHSHIINIRGESWRIYGSYRFQTLVYLSPLSSFLPQDGYRISYNLTPDSLIIADASVMDDEIWMASTTEQYIWSIYRVSRYDDIQPASHGSHLLKPRVEHG